MFIKTHSISEKMKLVQTVLILCILLTLAFIFTQSTLPTEVVSQEADNVSDIITEILPPDSAAADYAEDNLDKIAHFTEFSVLGFFVSLYICLFSLRPLLAGGLSLLFAETVALFDETIQIFSGRNPDIIDLWCDVFGFFTASIITYAAFFVIKGLIKRKNKW